MRLAMNIYISAVMGVTLLIGACSAEDKLNMEDEKVRIGYSVGYKIGSDFKRQGMDINEDMLMRGLKDAMSEKKPLFSPEEMQNALQSLQRDIVVSQNRNMEELREKNLKEGEAFLAQNSKKEGVVVLPSGLQYEVIEAGNGRSPGPTDTVTVNYRGTLIDGVEFDSSYQRGEPATFRADRVIAGWKEALQLMKEGSKWRLFIPAKLAYGERGAGPLIGPGSTLVFEVELISVKSPDKKAPTP